MDMDKILMVEIIQTSVIEIKSDVTYPLGRPE